MLNLLPTLESSCDIVTYALDETGVSVESDNHASWSIVGHPPILEKNCSHKGLNIVGSTAILNNYHIVNDIYPSTKSITSKEIKSHIQQLLDINEDKKVVIFLDNARTHNSIEMQKFYFDNKDFLEVVFLPKYSPYMNPQEHIWRDLKAKLYKPSSRSSIYELTIDINCIFDELNSNKEEIRSLADARNYLL